MAQSYGIIETAQEKATEINIPVENFTVSI